MNRLAKHLKPYRVQIFLALAAVIGGALAELGLPYFLADIVDRGVAQGDMKAISSIGGVMLALALLSILCALAAGYLAARISAGMGLSLRQQVFDHIGTFALADVERFGTASLITRSTNDVTQIQNVVMMLIRMVLRAPIVAVGGIVLAWSKSPTLAMVLLLAMPVLIVFVVLIARMALPLSGIMQTRVDRVNLVMREKLTGARVIRAFGNEAYERERFAQASDGLMHTATSMQRTTSLLMPVVNLVMSGTMVGLVWKGALLASYGGVQVGDIMALVQYATQILMAAMMLSMMFVMLPRAMASAQRINEVLDLTPTVANPESPQEGVGRGHLVFDHVSFTYPDAQEPALQDVSFSAGPGESTAIIGSTGSGKTTLLNLILRFYDVTEGRILIDGVDVRNYDQQTLRAKMGYVPQKSTLFSGTVAENLRWGAPTASDEALLDAARIAQAAEFLAGREGGLESSLAQGGINLSGGQKQRISIARAVARRPEIYLFDDSFSALDFTTDARLRAALADSTRDACVLIVAQRVSTILRADRIVVLEAGKVAGVGTHTKLMLTCEVYREIVSSQLSEGEWEEWA